MLSDELLVGGRGSENERTMVTKHVFVIEMSMPMNHLLEERNHTGQPLWIDFVCRGIKDSQGESPAEARTGRAESVEDVGW